MNIEKRENLIRKVQAQSLSEQADRHAPLLVVSLEDFFEGNDDLGSIGCNLAEDEHPGPEGFYSVLKGMRDFPEVQDVLVEVSEIEADTWPFSERVYVLTSAAQDTIAEWLKPLYPSEVKEGSPWGQFPSTFPSLELGVKVYTVWWD